MNSDTNAPILLLGDCAERLKELPDNSVDSVCTDPPYGLSFMGKKWDYDVPKTEVWREVYRVLKPGGHLLSFFGTRTYHRGVVNIEDAGFEIRDQIAWVYGQGFPKSLDVSKAIDKAAGAEREVVGTKLGQPGYSLKANDTENHGRTAYGEYKDAEGECAITAPATEAAKQWEGWGTALKPAMEPIVVARKPLDGTVAENVQKWGVGALNIHGCRIEFANEADEKESKEKNQHEKFGSGPMDSNQVYGDFSQKDRTNYNPPGRWPANVIHDGSEEVTALFPESTSGSRAAGVRKGLGSARTLPSTSTGDGGPALVGSTGSAARFFYCAKTSKKDRGAGNNHPTVKPTDLMRYLVKMVTPPGGTVLDPFMGSGSTGKACALEGFGFIGVEMEESSFKIAEQRIGEIKEAA